MRFVSAPCPFSIIPGQHAPCVSPRQYRFRQHSDGCIIRSPSRLPLLTRQQSMEQGPSTFPHWYSSWRDETFGDARHPMTRAPRGPRVMSVDILAWRNAGWGQRNGNEQKLPNWATVGGRCRAKVDQFGNCRLRGNPLTKQRQVIFKRDKRPCFHQPAEERPEGLGIRSTANVVQAAEIYQDEVRSVESGRIYVYLFSERKVRAQVIRRRDSRVRGNLRSECGQSYAWIHIPELFSREWVLGPGQRAERHTRDHTRGRHGRQHGARTTA